jgi:hypothetical protein
MKVPFFSKSKKGEGDLVASSGSSSVSLSSSSSSGSLRGEAKERRKSGSFSRSLKERTGKLWSFGVQGKGDGEARKGASGEESPGGLSRELLETFRYFDKNGDGKISAGELGEVLRALGIKATEEDLDAMVREVDRDNDGFIDVEEFAQLNKMVHAGGVPCVRL